MIAPDNIPGYLVEHDRWLLWRTEQRINKKTGNVTQTKAPISHATGKHCDVTKPASWTSFAKVTAALGKSRAWDGFGIVLGLIEEHDEILIGLDGDSCLDDDGAIADWALQFFAALRSYTEYSPGGVGLKCVARIKRSDLPIACKLLDIPDGERDQARTRTFGEKTNGQHAPGVQLFLSGRFFTVTGRHWVHSPEDVTLLTLEQIAQLGALFGPKENRPAGDGARDDDNTEPDEAELRDKLGGAFVRNPRLRERWEGGTQGLNDTTRSGRDMSIVAMLVAAGFTKGETRAALRLFEHGKLPDEGPRYFEQMWSRTAATPRSEPEVPPEWEAQHPAVTFNSDNQQHDHGSRPPASSWPEPVDCFAPINTDPVDVTEGEVPPALWPFVNDTADRMGVARSSVLLGSLITCATVITDDWCIQPKQYDYTWTENARLWGAIVGPPAILKTPVINTSTRPLDHLEAEARKQWKEDVQRYTEELGAWRKARTAAKAKGEDFTTPEPRSPKRRRWMVESTTIEALQEVLRDDTDARFSTPARKVLLRQDELGEWLANLDRYHSGRSGADSGAWLRSYNGGPHSVDRIGRGSFTSSNWSACVLGGIQPEPIQRIAKEAADDGLLQRFLYDVPPPTEGGADRTPDQNAIERYRRLIPALAALHPPTAPDSRIVQFHAEAHTRRHGIDEAARNLAAMPDVSKRLQSAFGKWPGLFARLCLTFHLIEVADARRQGDLGPPADVVSVATAERVARYLRRVLLRHLLRADALMFATAQTGHVRWVAGHILTHELERITVRDIVRAYGALRAPEARRDLANVMASLASIGWVDPEAPRNPLAEVSAWRVNPAVHQTFAHQAAQERQDRQQRGGERRA